jgi:hypothetical protein
MNVSRKNVIIARRLRSTKRYEAMDHLTVDQKVKVEPIWKQCGPRPVNGKR